MRSVIVFLWVQCGLCYFPSHCGCCGFFVKLPTQTVSSSGSGNLTGRGARTPQTFCQQKFHCDFAAGVRDGSDAYLYPPDPAERRRKVRALIIALGGGGCLECYHHTLTR